MLLRNALVPLAIIALFVPTLVGAIQTTFDEYEIDSSDDDRARYYFLAGADRSSLNYSPHCDCFVLTTSGDEGIAVPIGNISEWFSETSNKFFDMEEVGKSTRNFGSASQIEFYEDGRNGMYISKNNDRVFSFTISSKGDMNKHNQEGDCSNSHVTKFCGVSSISLSGMGNFSLLDMQGGLEIYLNNTFSHSYQNITSHTFFRNEFVITQMGKLGLVNLQDGLIKFVNTSETCHKAHAHNVRVIVECSSGLYSLNTSTEVLDYLFLPPGDITEIDFNSQSGKIAFIVQNEPETLYLYDIDANVGASKQFENNQGFIDVEFSQDGTFLMVLGMYDSHVLKDPSVIPKAEVDQLSTDLDIFTLVGVGVVVIGIAIFYNYESSSDSTNIPKVLFYVVFWPIMIVIFIVLALAGIKAVSDRNYPLE